MDNIKQGIKSSLLELFFPSFCLGCKKEGTFLCQDCKATLEISEYNYCLCNKNPFRLPSHRKHGKCNRCQDKKLSGLYFALPYQERFLTKRLIYQYKYEPYLKSLAKNLAEILIEHLILAKNNIQEIWQNSFFTAVPMEKKKLKRRGYNQAEQLSKELSKILKVPFISNNLVKVKSTLPQIELSAKEREENVKGAFLVRDPSAVKGKKTFLVDDVYTTGSTMEECARILKEVGAKQVWGIAIAREG